MSNDATNNPTSAYLLDLASRYKGKSGNVEDEWAVGWQKGDPNVRVYSGIGTETARLAERLAKNPAACLSVREDSAGGVWFNIDKSEFRGVHQIVHGTPAEVRSARGRSAFGHEVKA